MKTSTVLLISIVLLLTSAVEAKKLYGLKKKSRRYSKCYVVRTTTNIAKRYSIPIVPFIAIALHESELDHLALGDHGYSFGAWQLHSKLWKPDGNPFKPEVQAKKAAWLFKIHLSRAKTLRGAIQRWNYNSKGYARRVLKKRKRAERWIKRCQDTRMHTIARRSLPAFVVKDSRKATNGLEDMTMISLY